MGLPNGLFEILPDFSVGGNEARIFSDSLGGEQSIEDISGPGYLERDIHNLMKGTVRNPEIDRL